jgi:arabinogalactan oligomer/maltooligosaccharide transport system permease protein
MNHEGKERVSWLEAALTNLVMVVAVALTLYPVLWVIALALSKSQSPEPRLFPVIVDRTTLHFEEVIGSHDASGAWLFARWVLNSLAVAAATAVVGIVLAVPAGYALARFDFVGKAAGVRALLASQMFPTVASLIPLFFLLHALGLLNTRSGLVLCYAATAIPFAIFQLRAAFEAIPPDLEEAAMVDGATRFQAFLRVVLPAARPAIAVTGLFAFMSAYNEFILAATLLGREDMFTLPVALQRYVGEHDQNWPAFAAGAILVSAPVMALFYLVQRHLVAGLTAGAVKG